MKPNMIGQAIRVLHTAVLAGVPSAPAPAGITAWLPAFLQDNYVEMLGILPAMALLAMLALLVHIDVLGPDAALLEPAFRLAGILVLLCSEDLYVHRYTPCGLMSRPG